MLCNAVFPKRVFRWCGRLHYWLKIFNHLWNNIAMSHGSKTVILPLNYEPCDLLKSVLCDQILWERPWNVFSIPKLIHHEEPSPKCYLFSFSPRMDRLGSETIQLPEWTWRPTTCNNLPKPTTRPASIQINAYCSM